VAAIGAYFWLRRRSEHLPEAYVSERSATLWSSLAQVRQPMATLHYGQRVTVLLRRGEQVHVRTRQGVTGWLDARLLMEPALWERSAQLLVQARALPVQARGHTKVVSNLRIEPGRAGARIYQFSRGTRVEVLSRTVAEWSTPGDDSQATSKQSGEEPKPRREDWLLVRGFASSAVGSGGIGGGAAKSEESPGSARPEESVEVAGWVLGRFVELDLPGPIRDYASSSGMRVVAWVELNRVPDEASEKPQYLAAGVRGGEGQECDFTLIRVYTWGARRKRYETAYIESRLCGRLPIRVAKAASGEPEFRFGAVSKAGYEERLYRMRQTVVRRVRESQQSAIKTPRKSR